MYVYGGKRMGEERKEMTAPVWFDQWCRQAESRRARKKRVAEMLIIISNILITAGILIMLVGVMWIDSMDICKANALLSFGGLAVMGVGTKIKWVIERGGYYR